MAKKVEDRTRTYYIVLLITEYCCAKSHVQPVLLGPLLSTEWYSWDEIDEILSVITALNQWHAKIPLVGSTYYVSELALAIP